MDSVFKWFVINHIMLAFCEWFYADQSLPKSDASMSAGSFNGSIFIIGGLVYGTQVTEWNSITKEFSYYGDDYLNIGIYARGQSFTQKDEILYLLNFNNYINIFNLKTKQFDNNWKTTDSLDNFDDTACLASSQQYLFVVGGGGTYTSKGINNLYILQFSNKEWISNAPNLNEARFYHACVVHNGYLWAFTGGYWTTNERIIINDILNNEWEYVDPFISARPSPRAIAFEDYIYIVSENELYIMNANAGTMTQSVDYLPYTAVYQTVLLFDESIHVFGGRSGGGTVYFNTWIYYPLTSWDPTIDPTLNPSVIPTNEPTIIPSTLISSSDTIHLSTKMLYKEGAVVPMSSNMDHEQNSTEGSNDGASDIDILAIILIIIICVVSIVIIVIMMIFSKEWIMKRCKQKSIGVTVNEIQIQKSIQTDIISRDIEVPHKNINENMNKKYITNDETKGNIADDEFEVIGDEETDGNQFNITNHAIDNVNYEGM